MFLSDRINPVLAAGNLYSPETQKRLLFRKIKKDSRAGVVPGIEVVIKDADCQVLYRESKGFSYGDLAAYKLAIINFKKHC
jgi:hypothetical protein